MYWAFESFYNFAFSSVSFWPNLFWSTAPGLEVLRVLCWCSQDSCHRRWLINTPTLKVNPMHATEALLLETPPSPDANLASSSEWVSLYGTASWMSGNLSTDNGHQRGTLFFFFWFKGALLTLIILLPDNSSKSLDLDLSLIALLCYVLSKMQK